jgi:glycerophosphoryl diester phosphodiesterase
MIFINKQTGEKLNSKKAKNRFKILLEVLNPVYPEYMMISSTLNALIDEYKNAELQPYIPTKSDYEHIKRDPDFALDIPKYYVPEYDKIVSSSKFDDKIRQEFISRCNIGDPNICIFIEKYNHDFEVDKETVNNKVAYQSYQDLFSKMVSNSIKDIKDEI